MSLLFPLYALGALAVSLPLVFHLIQRRPRRRLPFSSLMFLTPSPPRMTRRSRLDNLLLLLLRAAALLLLAAAFARPFVRSLADLQLDAPSRRIVLLVDTSASMRREGAWPQAVAEAGRVLDDIRPSDRVALATFDTAFHWLVGFDDSLQLEPGPRAAGLRAALEGAQPGWGATDLGQALTTAADALQSAVEGDGEQGTLPPQIVLVSDLQAGSELRELDRFEWPRNVRLDIRQVEASGPTNASLVLLSDPSTLDSPLSPRRPGESEEHHETIEEESDAGVVVEDAASDEVPSNQPSSNEPDTNRAATTQLAVRVINAAHSTGSQFRLGWADEQGQLQGEREYPVNVPPGQSRVVRVDPVPSSHRLLLIGDDHPFDNTLYVARRPARERQVIYLGRDSDDRDSLLYYLRRAALDTPWQRVRVTCLDGQTSIAPGGPLADLDPRDTPLVVVAEAVPEATAEAFRRRYLPRGGRVLVVLTQSASAEPALTRTLAKLLDLPNVTVEEVETADYAMLETIDFQHPLFLPFADPKYSDFTGIRFWTHRRLAAEEEVTWDTLAAFDDGAPALIEQRVGQGVCRVLTSGWQPAESQLALSTKFVPLLSGMLDPLGGQPPVATSYRVGQSVALPRDVESGTIVLPDRKERTLTRGTRFEETDRPGIYAWRQGDRDEPFAVNLDPRESRTQPLDPGQLEQRGVLTGKAPSLDEIEQQQRQLRDRELESRQKWWRWLVAAAVGVLVVETWLGGWYSRRRRAE